MAQAEYLLHVAILTPQLPTICFNGTDSGRVISRIMKPAKKILFTSANALRYYILVASLYIVLILNLPPNKNVQDFYNLETFEYRIILLALALPILAIWLAAFIGYAKLHQYAHSVRHTPQGLAFTKLATGCLWLAWSLPVMTLVPFILSSLGNKWPDFHPPAVIITNYVSLGLALIAFSFIASASRFLLANSKVGSSSLLLNARSILLSFLTIGVTYCFLTFRQFDLSSLAAANNAYFLPIWLMILTVTVPFLYAWFIGLLAAYEILAYSRQEKGLLYRQALSLVGYGLFAVILGSIALQYTSSVMPTVEYLTLDYHFLLTLLFRVISGVGFILLAVGASRLKKFEDI